MKKLIELHGNNLEIGNQIGKMFTKEIKKFINARYSTISVEFNNNNLNFEKEDYYQISKGLIRSLKSFTPNEYDEVVGVSEGSDTNIEDVIFALGYSDIFDFLYRDYKNKSSVNIKSDECTSFISPPNCNRSRKIYVGQTWDMPPGTEKYTALFHKMLDDDNEFYSYTTVLGLTHMGMNSSGVCIGTTNVATTETEIGLIFPALIQSALSRHNCKESVEAIKTLPKISGHYYYIASQNTPAYAIEVSALNCKVEEIYNGIYVHANHYKTEIFQKNAINYSPSSCKREQKLEDFLTQNCGKLTVDDCINILASHKAGICRHSQKEEKIPSETCGAVIFSPVEKKMFISFGYPCKNKWNEISLNKNRRQ